SRPGPRLALAIRVLFETQPPLDVNLPALRQIFVGHLGLASPSRDPEPDRVLLSFAPGVPALFGRGDGKVANGRALRRVAQFRVTTQVTDDGDLIKRHSFSPFRNEIEIFELEVRRAPPSSQALVAASIYGLGGRMNWGN